jgi:osmoprotectant transport system ATP-binding protein
MEENGHRAVIVVGPRGRARGFIDIETTREEKGKVGEHQQALPTTIRPTENLRTAVSSMFRYDVNWLACVDDDGMFVGYVTMRAITQLLAAAYRDD